MHFRWYIVLTLRSVIKYQQS